MSATLTKSEARYVEKSKDEGERCGNCSMYIPGGSCTLVKGAIASAGYCKHWEAKRNVTVTKA